MQIKVTASGNTIAAEGAEKGEIRRKISLTSIHRKERGSSFSSIERKTKVIRSMFQSNQGSLSASAAAGVDQMVKLSAYEEQLTEKARDTRRSLIKENGTGARTANSGIPRRAQMKQATCIISNNHASTTVTKKLKLSNKARKEASQNRLMKERGMSDRVKSLGNFERERIVQEPGLDLLNPFKMD